MGRTGSRFEASYLIFICSFYLSDLDQGLALLGATSPTVNASGGFPPPLLGGFLLRRFAALALGEGVQVARLT